MHAGVIVPLWIVALALVAAAGGLGAATALWRRRGRRLRELAHETERLRELAKGRAERVSVLSHEIKTPLALIRGAGELLAEETPGPLNPRQRQFVGTITDNSGTVIDMAENLLVEARLEATLFDVHLMRTELRGLVRQTVRELRRVQDAEIRLDSRGAPLHAVVDRRLMRQALWNLLNNAARHAEGEHVVVRVTGGEEAALIAVSDAGRGIAVRDQAALFEPFVTGASRRPGAGLGMMITRRIAETHGGRLFVDSIPQRGTTIFLSVPLMGGT